MSHIQHIYYYWHRLFQVQNLCFCWKIETYRDKFLMWNVIKSTIYPVEDLFAVKLIKKGPWENPYDRGLAWLDWPWFHPRSNRDPFLHQGGWHCSQLRLNLTNTSVLLTLELLFGCDHCYSRPRESRGAGLPFWIIRWWSMIIRWWSMIIRQGEGGRADICRGDDDDD